MSTRAAMLDANEAVAQVAYAASEVIAIYPITPATPMGEACDAWSAAGKPNLFGTVPQVIEMQSEGGAAGTVHGALQAGALTTTFTASQGLLLMIPNMYKIAGELTPCVIHVAARTLATHALSIFGDHSDVMAARGAGWAMLCSSSVQEAHDFGLIAHAATLRTRVPVLHFFDGFRTSHEVNKVDLLGDEDLQALLDPELIRAHRARALSPDHPVLRGTAQNPDVFFQAREAANPYYDAAPGLLQETMDEFARRTGRAYRLFDYAGHPEAERVLILMGSGCGAAEEAVESLVARGEKVGVLKVRLFRPFSAEAFLAALPASVRGLAVLDRSKEPGASGDPLFQEVAAALYGGSRGLIGGRYGLSSKEFTPAMAAAALRELEAPEPRPRFTLGIVDDVTHLSLSAAEEEFPEPDDVFRAVFYGLGSDGTVGANKNSVKIVGENTALHAQGYFVYDSKKAGSVTVSHLRFSPRKIHSTYLIGQAQFVACHQFSLLERIDVLERAAPGGTLLLNSPHAPDEVWGRLPENARRRIVELGLKLFVVNADAVAEQAGLGRRINTVMQVCFFALARVLPLEEAVEHIKEAIRKSYGKRGETVLRRNFAAVDSALDSLVEVPVPTEAPGATVPETPPAGESFLDRVTRIMISGRGETLPVSALPVDGAFPTGTAGLEKRSIAAEIPIWDPAICIDCGLCALVCPHAAIRMKIFPAGGDHHPAVFSVKSFSGRDFPEHQLRIQVAPDDCTGCGVCVDVCPARSKEAVKHKAINMEPKEPHLERERGNFEHFLEIPELDRSGVKLDTVKGSQLLLPLFEFSGACAGCGETPYLKLLSQLFGDRMLIANATGCSSIYGGNLPTTPWSRDSAGRGPAWSNSLFEDNAEFGLGMRLAVDQLRGRAVMLLEQLRGELGEELARPLIDGAACRGEGEIAAQRERVAELKRRLAASRHPTAPALLEIADYLVDKSVWIIGGDGWAYDIGYGGVDHVLASGRDVNLLVLDTGVYSNTGGQASKATPRGAVAKFTSGGKGIRRKDLGLMAVSYGDVYVAQIAIGANPNQTLKAFHEAAAYPGPSLILAYSQCIAHGIDMSTGMSHQKLLVNSGFWPLYRFDPLLGGEHGHPFHLDSRKPTVPFREVAEREGRFAMLARANPAEAERLFALAQRDIEENWRLYEQLAGVEREAIGLLEETPR